MRQIKSVERLTDQQTALLMAKHVAPVAVSEILMEGRKLEEDESLALHQILSDREPDTAFLAMAGSIAELGHFHGIRKTPLMGTLPLQARQYVAEYAPLWLANADNVDGAVDNDLVYDLLSTLPEDLEALNEMIVIVQSSSAIDETSKQLLRVFQIQSSAHQLISEALLEEFDNLRNVSAALPSFDEIESIYSAEETLTNKFTGKIASPNANVEAIAQSNNVIAFPAFRP
jgi:hypothetical protein